MPRQKKKMLPKDPFNIRLSGRGGQGILLAGIILAEAGMKDGLNVVQTQSYGPQARLGASKSEVVLSGSEIAFPEVDIPDVLLCLTIDSYVKYGGTLSKDGIRIVEKMVTIEEEVEDAMILPVIETARALGDEIAANMVALGSVIALSGAVSKEHVMRTMEERIKPDYLELNKRAFQKGIQLVSQSDMSYQANPEGAKSGF
ncbi:MAG TPA: 2-oxoacid:acceptor oxidoreductase family protein [Balneolaceae bacterium]|nr:2-oxoacid:acceptor oxidoreductase family protein [Balneolaceae bacterium]